MTESLLRPEIATPDTSIQTWIRRLLWKIALATWLLMAVGSATRVMNAGLACPDWPLCYGQLIPSQQMNLQVFLEWFHRLDAALIGLSTLTLVGLTLWFRRSLPNWLPWASLFAFGLILFQGVLGGLTVTQLLRFDIVTAHLGTALLFLCTILVMGIYLLPYRTIVTPIGLQILATITVILIYGQSLLGGLVASRWAVHQCLGDSQLCQVMNRHLFGVIPTTLGVLLLGLMAWRTPTLDADLKKLAYLALGLVIVQILLGWATLHFHLQVEPLTVAHHTIGAALLATSVAFTARSFRWA